MLGEFWNPLKMKFPVLATPKLDGFRLFKSDGEIFTRSHKIFPNKYVHDMLQAALPDGADGEVVCVDENGRMLKFNRTSSLLRQVHSKPGFLYFMFDYVKEDVTKPYGKRIIDLMRYVSYPDWIKPWIPILIEHMSELEIYERRCVEDGFEGVVTRTPNSPYKFGRSTVNQGWLLKIKRWKDGIAEIIEFVELRRNDNPAFRNELGYTDRQSVRDGLRPGNTLGALLVRDTTTGVEFELGTGYTALERDLLWGAKDNLAGPTAVGKSYVRYKSFPYGAKDKPRSPVYVGPAEEWDMDESGPDNG